MPRTILVVEDDRLNMRLFHDLLTCEGYETLEAGDGEAALALTEGIRPDLVLLDVQLPGMSGLDLVHRLKGDPRLSTVPIIAVTALALRSHESLIRASGVDAYVTKPFSVSELMQIVRGHLPAERAPGPAGEDDGSGGDAEEESPGVRPWSFAPGFSLNDPQG